jgi:hypothetical protein
LTGQTGTSRRLFKSITRGRNHKACRQQSSCE